MRASCGNVPTLSGEGLFESRDEEVNVTGGRTGPHEADAPDLPGKGTEPHPNLDVELLQEIPAHCRFVYTVRDSNGIYCPQTFVFGRKDRQAQGLQVIQKQPVMLFMTLPPGLEPFFLDDRQRFSQCAQERR